MMQPGSLSFALFLRDAVAHCSLTPVTAQFVADGDMGGWVVTARSTADAAADRSYLRLRVIPSWAGDLVPRALPCPVSDLPSTTAWSDPGFPWFPGPWPRRVLESSQGCPASSCSADYDL